MAPRQAGLARHQKGPERHHKGPECHLKPGTPPQARRFETLDEKGMGKHFRRHQGARQICTAGPADQRGSRNMKSETVDSHKGVCVYMCVYVCVCLCVCVDNMNLTFTECFSSEERRDDNTSLPL